MQKVRMMSELRIFCPRSLEKHVSVLHRVDAHGRNILDVHIDDACSGKFDPIDDFVPCKIVDGTEFSRSTSPSASPADFALRMVLSVRSVLFLGCG